MGTIAEAGWIRLLAAIAFATAAGDAVASRTPATQAPAKYQAAGAEAKAPSKPKAAAWLGISFEDIPAADLPPAFAHPSPEGAVRIRQVFNGTSADQAGLKEGDYILSVNGAPLAGRKTLLDTIRSKSIGDIVALSVGRDGKAFDQKMALSPKPEDMQAITRMLVGSPAPALDGKYYSGDAGPLAANKGKVVLIDFWATWCGPCIATMPALDALYKKYREKGLVVIGVSSENLEELKAFQARTRQSYPMFNDIGQLTTRKYQAFAYPTLVIVDRGGTVQRIEVGAHSFQAMEKWVLEHL